MAKKDFNINSTKNMPEFKLNPGSTSILLIFVTLCLVAFAVLCVVSSNSDRKLGNKVITRTSVYYTACNRAQEIISEIDDDIVNAYNSSNGNKKAFFDAMGGETVSFYVDVDEKQKLYVELTLDYPDGSAEAAPLYHISSWRIGSENSSNSITIE